VYKKALYREFSDEAFKNEKIRTEKYLGVLGPVIYAEVGDTIEVVFKNDASRNYSVHPHGVFFR
jgi:FtsP/CotA-like multicopper oxidase with cupredoxin domain